MEKQVVQFQFGGQGVTLETGAIARQATGAVVITMGETQILATVVAVSYTHLTLPTRYRV